MSVLLIFFISASRNLRSISVNTKYYAWLVSTFNIARNAPSIICRKDQYVTGFMWPGLTVTRTKWAWGIKKDFNDIILSNIKICYGMNAKKYADLMKIKDKRLPYTLYVWPQYAPFKRWGGGKVNPHMLHIYLKLTNYPDKQIWRNSVLKNVRKILKTIPDVRAQFSCHIL